ncbi:MAG: hypothetical protein KDA20_01365 [Phycisphaerales bacterium]|nr:hypothetical protein [Phycisphaerales bacterium]
MRITVNELRNACDRLLSHLEESGQTEFDFDDDLYWDIPADVRYDAYSPIEAATAGQLEEDWKNVVEIQRGNSEPVGYALVWLSTIMRRVGEAAF